MDCNQIKELISLYIDEELGEEDINKLEAHIKSCDKCKAEFSQLLDIVDGLKSIPQLDLPDNFHTELMSKLKEDDVNDVTLKSKKQDFKLNKSLKAFLTTAACFIFLMTGILISNLNNADRDIPFANSAQSTADDKALLNGRSLNLETENMALNDDLGNADNAAGVINDKKIIKSAEISIEVYDFETTMNNLKSMAQTTGGYVENTNTYINYNDTVKNVQLKSGNVKLRIPTDKFSSIISDIASMGKVISNNESNEDITTQYVDTESILKAKKLEEERLLKLIDQAQTVEDLILLEERLSKVRADLEIYNGRINNWDRLIDLAAINVSVTQVKELAIDTQNSNLSTRIKEGFIKSINTLRDTVENIVVWTAEALPVIIIFIILVLIIFIIYLLIKRYKKRKK